MELYKESRYPKPIVDKIQLALDQFKINPNVRVLPMLSLDDELVFPIQEKIDGEFIDMYHIRITK